MNKVIESMRHFGSSDVAKERLRVIEFYDEFGEKATKKAFKINRKTVWVWKKRLKDNTKHLSSLVPHSTRPKRVREMKTDSRIISFIRILRQNHPRLGKEKIKPLLDVYCHESGIQSITVSTIGKVIKRNKLFYPIQGRTYHDPSRKKHTWRTKRKRVTRAPKDTNAGYIQMDTITRYVDGLKVYVYSAISISSKFAFSYHHISLNSRNTVDFFKKLEIVCPFPITTIQTDNGLEFLGEFEEYLTKRNIPHVFIYPRCCKVNGVVERYQRSMQEEFLDNNLEFVYNPKKLNDKLMNYLLFYNTKRVHKSIGLRTPMDYLIMKGEMSKMYMTRTPTLILVAFLISYSHG